MEKPERIAFLGLGIMGSRMAANLARAGFDVTVWNRTPERADELAAAAQVTVAGTPAEAARGAGIVVTIVTDAPQVEEVLFGEHGVASALEPGALVVDMTTVSPEASRDFARRLGELGVHFLDAPVTGSKPRAEDATLTIMVGGPAEDLGRARPALEAMGTLIVHAGPHGHGSLVKLINNMVAATNALAVAEALELARRAGAHTDALLEVMRAGSGASTMLELKAGPILSDDYDPLFKLAHMLKDLRYAVAEAEQAGLELPLATAAERAYAEADKNGLGDLDFAAVARTLK